MSDIEVRMLEEETIRSAFFNALQYYAYSGDAAYLLMAQRGILGVLNSMGDTALHTAISAGREEAALCLSKIALKEDLNIYNKDLQTPLHLATINENFTVVSALLNLGADAALPDNYGNTILHLACRAGYHAIVTAVLECNTLPKGFINVYNHAGQTALHLAVYSGNVETLSVLLQHMTIADVNFPESSSKRTALHIAARLGFVDLVLALLSAGIDIDKQDIFGNTALHVCAECNESEVASALVTAGADVCLVNSYYKAPLAIAHERSSIKIISVLLSGTTDLYELENEWQMLSIDDVTTLPSSQWQDHSNLNTCNAKNMVTKILHKSNKAGYNRLVHSKSESEYTVATREKKALTPKYSLTLEVNVVLPTCVVTPFPQKSKVSPHAHIINDNVASKACKFESHGHLSAVSIAEKDRDYQMLIE